MSPLLEAIEAGDLPRLKSLLTESPSSIDETAGPLHAPLALIAAEKSSFPVLRYIVEYSRASLDIFDDDHRNILHYAALSGDPQKCRYLTERCGMDPLSGDRNLMTPYEISFRLASSSPSHRAVYEYFRERAGAPFEDLYRNPVRTGFFPDPSVVAVGSDYYMVNSSFIFFPCIPVSHSRDLVHWEIIGYAVTDPEWAMLEDLEGGRGFWAPDISYDRGTFYITATYRLNDSGPVYRRQMVVSSSRPEGPYSKPVFIEEDGIDPSIFHEDGRHYMLLNRGARLFELSEDCTRQISEATLLYYGSQKHAPEGSHLLKKDGWYYLFQAEGGTGPGHRITVSRSRTLFGVYEPCPYNPIMRQQDPEAAIQRCGHGKPVQTPDGRWYMVYLCGRPLEGKYSILGRETALDPITWTPDGWPLVNSLKGPSVLQKKPFPALKEEEKSRSLPLDPLEWVTPRAPEKGAVTWLGDGTVRLKSSPAPLSRVDARNIFLKRQTRFDFTARALLELPPLKEGQEAGLVCYYDENTWAACTAKKEGKEGLSLCVTEHIGLETFRHPAGVLKEEKALLSFECETRGLSRTFRIFCGEDLLYERTCPSVTYLCDEGIRLGKRFTGAMTGVFGAGEEPFFYRLLSYEEN